MRHSGWKPVLFMVGLGISLSLAPAFADQSHGSHGSAFKSEWGSPGVASKATRVIRVTAIDVAFDVKKLHVKAGETVRFVVTNKGALVHEFVLASAADHKAHEQEMMNMDPSMAMPDEPNAISLKPGETKELVWTFAAAKNIEFACDIPGHPEQGMKGSIEIKRN